MRLLPTLATAAAVGLVGVALAPAAHAADPTVDISVEATSSSALTISPSRPADADISLVNRGDAAQDASFSFEVPTGWTVEEAFASPTDETCGLTGSTYTCTITAIAGGYQRSTQLLITAAPGTPVGSVTTVAVTGGPVGAVDSDPSNNSTQFTFRNVGTSNVVGTMTQSATTIPVGGTVTFTVTLTNRGPDATVGQGGLIRVETATTDGFHQDKPVGPGNIQEGGGESAANAGPDYTFDGELEANSSAVYTVTWTGLKVGAVGHLRFTAGHQPDARDISGIVLLNSRDVTVVAAGAGSAPTAPSPAPTTPDLANTGTDHVGGSVAGGLGAVVLGASLLVLGRRRRGRHTA